MLSQKDQVAELQQQVGNLIVAIERNTNAHSQTQMLADKLKGTDEKVAKLEGWQNEINTERSEQRGAAKQRRSMLAIIAGLAGLAGSAVGAVIQGLLKAGG